jgi:hypothetical protein
MKMDFSGWTKDVEDVSLLSKLGTTAVNECSKCLTNNSTNIRREKIKMGSAVYLLGFTSHVSATRNVTDKKDRKWGGTRHSKTPLKSLTFRQVPQTALADFSRDKFVLLELQKCI